MKCTFPDCNDEAGSLKRCDKHAHVLPKPPTNKYLGRTRTMRVGKERKRAVYPGPSNSPNGIVHVILDVRSNLVGRLADALGDDHANAIVGALDAYLEADPGDRLPSFQLLPRHYTLSPRAELDKALKERDEAVARAEKAEAVQKKRARVKP